VVSRARSRDTPTAGIAVVKAAGRDHAPIVPGGADDFGRREGRRTTGTVAHRLIPWWYVYGMSVQMTIRVDDNLAAFVDQAANAGEGSRADVINRAIKREIRRRAAERDAQIYASQQDPDLDSDAYAIWATRNAGQVWSDLD